MCLYTILFCVVIMLAPKILGALFFHHLNDEEIIDAVGDKWKDIYEIKATLIESHSNLLGGPFPKPTPKYLSKKLAKLVAEKELEWRMSSRWENSQFYEVVEYRILYKKYTRKDPKNSFLIPHVVLEGV